MKNIFKMSLLIFSFLFFIQSPQITKAANFEWGTVNVSSGKLNVRTSPSSTARIIGSYSKGKKLKCLTLKTTWVKVNVDGKVGYAYGKYIDTAYGTAYQPYKNIRKGVTNDKTVVRATRAHTASAVVIVPKGKNIQVLTKDAAWVKVKYDGKTGYCVGKKITISTTGKTAAGTTAPGAPTPVTTPTPSNESITTKGNAVIAYAKLFLGNRYVYGGTSLTNGTDCSGYTMRIYQHFGYSIPRTSAEQRYCGTKVASLSQALPGDLICYYGHVALYMGNNTIIHASNAKDGIKISYNAAYRDIAAIRRVLK